MEALVNDLRYTFREFRKRPAFTITAILSLALGIGATSAVFSVIYAVLIDPFPYPHSDRIVSVQLIDKTGDDRGTGFSGSQIDQLRQLKSFESVVADQGWNLVTTDGDVPDDVQALGISTESPDFFGMRPMLGRWLIPSDAPPGQDAQQVVVLSYDFWLRYFMGDPNVIGRKIQLVHVPYEVVGVMPPRFKWGANDLYRPLKVAHTEELQYDATIRLRPGVTLAQANAELQPLLEHYAKEHPQYYPESFRVNIKNIIQLYAAPLGPTLYLLLGAVVSLLLIGCGNVSILLLARGAERQREFAVRAAVGANRNRMVRQLLTESLAIAISGTALGLLIAWRGLALIVAFLPEDSFPSESVIKINIPVVLFSVALAFATTLLFGIWPALQLSRPDLAQLLQNGMRRIAGSTHARRTHTVMVGAQVALTVLMLTLATTAAKGFLHIVKTNLGYDPSNAMSLPIPIHQNSHVAWQDRAQYFDNLVSRIAQMPQVEMAGISTDATPPWNGADRRIEIMNRANSEKPEVRLNFISSEYFQVLRIPLAQGRLWDHAEIMRGANLAVVNETMARQFWPNGNAIGQEVKIVDMKSEPPYSPAAPDAGNWLQIIGIAADARDDGLRKPVRAGLYVPYTLQMWMFTQILVRTRVPPLSILHDLRAQIAKVDHDQQVIGQPRDLNGWIARMPEYAQQRLAATLFGIFAILALALATVGLYSVVSFGVATRTNEFGIRMALGADASKIFRLVLASTVLNVSIGLAAGLALSLALGKLVIKWVNESSRDPLILGAVTLLLISAALLAAFLPARRASSTDPMIALRYE
jgi:putative ABC transport system permease protein